MKNCSICGELKPLTEFSKDKRRKHGRDARCVVCTNIRINNWENANREKKKKNREKHLYGIVPEQKEKMLVAQNNCCAICKTQLKIQSKIHIDHCHKTNTVRGILCNYCNIGLGHFKDNIQILEEAIKYLKRAMPEGT